MMQTVLYAIAKAILPRLTTFVFNKAAENLGIVVEHWRHQLWGTCPPPLGLMHVHCTPVW